jgi:hypothetical protein
MMDFDGMTDKEKDKVRGECYIYVLMQVAPISRPVLAYRSLKHACYDLYTTANRDGHFYVSRIPISGLDGRPPFDPNEGED